MTGYQHLLVAAVQHVPETEQALQEVLVEAFAVFVLTRHILEHVPQQVEPRVVGIGPRAPQLALSV